VLSYQGAIHNALRDTAAGDDGLLKSEEILNLTLDAEVVVLSACNTGQGRMTGDGVIGLARAFVVAWVPSVVVSLWSVADDSTFFPDDQVL
jgi:CHAT domain-containing protein